jgi:putative hemolysin
MPIVVISMGSWVLPPASWGDDVVTESPNPASIYCRDRHGRTLLLDQGSWGGAQLGVCELGEGALEEWTLYNDGPLHRPQQAILAYRRASWHTEPGPIENWARRYCAKVGGTIESFRRHLRPDSEVLMCRFPDGSLIEEWTLFSGRGYSCELARQLGLPCS